LKSAVQIFTNVALSFAQDLVDENFEHAFQLLSPALQSQFSPPGLRQMLWRMFESYAPDDRPLRAVLDRKQMTSTNTDWPDKQPNDLGWVYVSILGAEFVEAVTVTVAHIDGRPLIRDIEWGRP
jgi:hypothetical protein